MKTIREHLLALDIKPPADAKILITEDKFMSFYTWQGDALFFHCKTKLKPAQLTPLRALGIARPNDYVELESTI